MRKLYSTYSMYIEAQFERSTRTMHIAQLHPAYEYMDMNEHSHTVHGQLCNVLESEAICSSSVQGVLNNSTEVR
jgi:hypothetical protein